MKKVWSSFLPIFMNDTVKNDSVKKKNYLWFQWNYGNIFIHII